MIRQLPATLAARIFENPKGVAYHRSTLSFVVAVAVAVGFSGTVIAYLAAAAGAALLLHAAGDTTVTDDSDPQRVPLARRDAALVGIAALLAMLTVAFVVGNLAPELRAATP